MATENGANWSTRYPMPVGNETVSFVVESTTVAASIDANDDILKVTKIPAKGVTFTDCFVQCADLDTNATPAVVFDLQVTDGTTTKTLISGATTGQAGGLVRPTKVPATENGINFTTDNKDYWVQAKFTTGAATGAAVAFNVGLTLSGFYNYGEIANE